jgi:hypothetical protein
MDPIKRLLACALVALAAPCAWAHSPTAPGSPHAVTAALPASPLAFEENKGQVRTTAGAAAPDVRFRLSQGGTQLFLLDNGIAYQFSRTHYPEGYAELADDARHDPQKQEQLDALRDQVRLETFRMNMRLEGASTNARITTEGRSSDYTQYYNHDALDVHSYTKVTYHEVYPGIDWVVYTTENGMKYDFVVRPGADPDMIRLRFEHHEELSVDAKGNLIHGNRMGRFMEERPVSFQDGKEVPTSFVLEGNTLRFALESYDRSRTLTIDPARIWGTYYGGAATDEGGACTTDANGNVYLTGVSFSASGLADNGHQNTAGGGWDGYLVKFNSAGQRSWATYYGGESHEHIGGCTVDASENVYLTGGTLSSTLIASGGHQNVYAGGNDAFLVKFDATGVRLWGTYYGGSGNDIGRSCTLDGSGNVYMSGETSSGTGIATGGHQNTMGGVVDAFLVKFSSSGQQLWGTYYGGAYTDQGTACTVDATGHVYLVGWTTSYSAIATPGSHQSFHGAEIPDFQEGLDSDAFLAKFDADGMRQWGTYYGAYYPDLGSACGVDGNGDIYLSGSTQSDHDIASGGHQDTYGGGDYDAFLAKFNTLGQRLWSTYYGGTLLDDGTFCAVDGNDNVYLAGTTFSTSGIAEGGHQNTLTDEQNAFLVSFSANGVRQWGTYYGGPGYNVGNACAVDADDNVYLTGITVSTSGIAESGHQNTFGGNSDAFLVKFQGDIPSEIQTGAITGSPFCAGSPVSVPFTVTGSMDAGNTFTAQLSNAAGSFANPGDIGSLSGTGSGTIEATIPADTQGGTGYRIRVVASEPDTEGDDNGANITVLAPGDACDDGDPLTSNDILDEECLCAGASPDPEITAYRYWFDDDIANATTIAVAPVPELLITEAFDAEALDGGLRRVSVQAQDNMGFWSSPQTSLFARVDAVVSGYRYWVNDDPSNMLTGTVTPAGVVDLSAALPISGADRPFNLITIQFLDPAGVYSAPLTKAFALTRGLVSGYRYWVNDDPTTMETVTVTPVELLDLTSPLAIGIADRSFNILTIQFRDAGGIFSVPYTTTFVRSTGPIVEYEYWIDDVIADRVSGNVAPADVADLIEDLPTSAPPGPHVFTIRFRGESGAWSVPLTTPFESLIEVFDCPVLEANIGEACDDGLANTVNDVITESCVCEGTLLNDDCEGVPGGPALPGTACNDNDPCTTGDVYDANCTCAGTFTDADADGTCDANDLCPGGPEPGTACNDNDDCTTGDVIDANCNCIGTFADADGDGTCDADDLCPGGPEPGTACNDNDDCTTGDVIDTNCNCTGTFADSDADGTCDADDLCPGGPEPGSACDDGNAATTNDLISASCVCTGVPVSGCEHELTLEFQTDGAPYEITWEIRTEDGNTVITSGGPLVAPFGVETNFTCLPDGCFSLRVLDSAGDGMTTGGYILRTTGTNNRIIDNRNNFSSGSVSAISAGLGFCLPMSNDKVIFTSCDKLDWISGQYVVAAPNAAVNAEWIVGGANNAQDANSGYEFWIFDPNGSYSFRRFRSHNQSDGFGPASATRACHMRLNNWAVANQVPANVLMNVRIRARINGMNGEFGPACRLEINSVLAACPRTKLMDIPGHEFYSCGVTRPYGAGNYVHARPVAGANRYQFRFRLPAEGFEVVRTASTYFVQLNWTGPTALQDGKTYDVDVRISKNGGATWCTSADPWGDVCLLTIDQTPANSGDQNFLGEGAAELRMFPNPNRGDLVNVSLSAVEKGVNAVSLDIYDLAGTRVSTRTLAVSGSQVNTVLDLNGELAAGMYLVNITAGETLYTERLVIQP